MRSAKRGVAQQPKASALGAEDRGCESHHPDCGSFIPSKETTKASAAGGGSWVRLSAAGGNPTTPIAVEKYADQ